MSTELAQAPEPEPLVAGRRAWMILGVISFSNFQLDLSPLVLPELVDALYEASIAQFLWVFNIPTIMVPATLVLAGAIGERWGRKRIILLGTAAFMVASVAAVLAPNVMVLIAAQVVQALALVATLPAGVATLVAAFPQNKRGTAIGIWLAAGTAAAVLGSLLRSFLIDFGGWQAVLGITLPLGAAAFVATWLVIPEYRLEAKTKKLLPDPLGSVMLAVGIAAIMLALIPIQDVWQWLERTIIIGAGAGAAVVVWVLWRSKDHPSPILDLKLFNYRSFAYGNAAMALLYFGLSAFQMSSYGFLFYYDTSKAGLLFALGFAFWVVGASVGGRMIDKLGSFWVAVPGSLFWLAGLGWLALGSTAEPNVWFWLGAVSLAGVGSGLLSGGVFAMSMIDLPGHFISLGTSVIRTVVLIGTSFGVSVVGPILGARSVEGFRVALAVPAIACVVAAALMVSGCKRSQAELWQPKLEFNPDIPDTDGDPLCPTK